MSLFTSSFSSSSSTNGKCNKYRSVTTSTTTTDTTTERTSIPIYRHESFFGGPNTIFPRSIESIACWSLALSCLSVSGYHYIMDHYIKPYTIHCMKQFNYTIIQRYLLYILPKSIISTIQQTEQQQQQQQQQEDLPCWLPLMTCSRAELHRYTPYERLEQLVRVIQSIDPSFISIVSRCDTDDDNNNKQQHHNITIQSNISDNELIQLIRTHEIIRRLVSLALRPLDHDKNCNNSNNYNKDQTIKEYNILHQQPLVQQIKRIWLQLLLLPPINIPSNNNIQRTDINHNNNHNTIIIHKIALIIPCYNEQSHDILQKLNLAYKNCNQPHNIHVIIVIAGLNAIHEKQNLIQTIQQQQQMNTSTISTDHVIDHYNQWGELKIVEFLEESGRGPCLNYGTQQVHESDNICIYTFCHSDTCLPYHWDTTIIQTLYPEQHNINEDNNYRNKKIKRTNSCAFNFGIDTSKDGLKNGIVPPGIGAIEVTANLRCKFWSLPYGDQCLSMRVNDFHYLGGFPHQCFMEDYELIALLRKRMKLLSQFRNNNKNNQNNDDYDEVLTILPGPPALCSPRRWQKLGVFYVTYTNSKLVNLYVHNSYTISPNDIYQLYYGKQLDATASLMKSPWEIQLDDILSKS